MKFVVQICISVIQIRTSVKKFSVYIIQIQIRVESIQIRHRSGQRLNWITVLRTCCIFGNLNDTNLDLNGVNANSNAGKIKSNDESVVHDPNLLNWMLINEFGRQNYETDRENLYLNINNLFLTPI